METMNDLVEGDYVLATKFFDGDSRDQWYVGFFIKNENGRYFVGDNAGSNARYTGFRKCKKISPEIGDYLVKNKQIISSIKINLWEFINSSILLHYLSNNIENCENVLTK